MSRWAALGVVALAATFVLGGLALRVFEPPAILVGLYWFSIIAALLLILWVAHEMHGARNRSEREQSGHDSGDDWWMG